MAVVDVLRHYSCEIIFIFRKVFGAGTSDENWKCTEFVVDYEPTPFISVANIPSVYENVMVHCIKRILCFATQNT